jgi:alcohol dehydrogenase
MCYFEFQTRTRLVFGNGALDRLGNLARDLGFRRPLLVADHGLQASGHVSEASQALAGAGIEAVPFHDFEANPDTDMVEVGRAFAASAGIDSIIGLGGGSSMDCAKAINFVLTNGGRMQDYHGYGKASKPMLPMIGIPTTAGTGSEAQSYALISDSATHVKMACGDPKAAFRIAILDPTLTVSEPAAVRAASGYDAISHAVESYVTTARNPASDLFAREAWRLLNGAYERVMTVTADLDALGSMLLGAHYAGVAIEHSMLGATHACANPLTARYGTAHGVAIAALLSHVVRWNESELYAGLSAELDTRLEQLAQAAGLPTRLGAMGVPEADLEAMAEEAARQWTARFNPRPLDRAAALEIYQCAY